MATPNVYAMVREWLVQHGYDGLCNEDCGCGVDDLMPSGECFMVDCVAAHKRPCKNGDDCTGCGKYYQGGCDGSETIYYQKKEEA